jgi:hypothetical protein
MQHRNVGRSVCIVLGVQGALVSDAYFSTGVTGSPSREKSLREVGRSHEQVKLNSENMLLEVYLLSYDYV